MVGAASERQAGASARIELPRLPPANRRSSCLAQSTQHCPPGECRVKPHDVGLRWVNTRKLGEVMMRFSDSYRSVAFGIRELPSGHFPDAESRLCRGAVKFYAQLLCLWGLVLCFLPLSLAAQTAREVQAETAIQAAKDAQQRGDYAQAVAGYQAAVKLMPETAELYGNLGIAYYLERDYPKAVEAFHQALKRKPGLEGPKLYPAMF